MSQNNKHLALIKIALGKKDLPNDFKALVVGCGSGAEAHMIALATNRQVIGIDLGNQFNFIDHKNPNLVLKKMDAHCIDFDDKFFDFIYSFHALEHMKDPIKVLHEMSRVLKSSGTFLIGVPNKNRVLGYIGSDTFFYNKMKWNILDWKMRLTGKWSNDFGAHAGFTEDELLHMCDHAFFSQARSITRDYYLELYGRSVECLYKVGLQEKVTPCVYVLGEKYWE